MKQEEMTKILRSLVDLHYECITKIYKFGCLPFENPEYTDGRNIAKVNSAEFSSFEQLQTYLSQIYTSAETARILKKAPEEEPLYFDKNGALYVNLDRASFAGLPAPWKEYSVSIAELTEQMCRFLVCVSYQEDTLRIGAGEITYEFTAVCENGWKLEKYGRKQAQ